MTSQIIGQGLRIKPKPVVEFQILRHKSIKKNYITNFTPSLQVVYRKTKSVIAQESRREGWTDAAIMLCKLNKSL